MTATTTCSFLARAARIATGALVAGFLAASCSMMPDDYPRKSDARPHPGVARALRMPIQGIDVSRYQGVPAWDAIARAGTKFVYIKATEGGDYVDPNFRQNWAGAQAAGIPRGAYHFVYWCRPAAEQAAWFTQHIPPDPDALPPVLDLEWNGHSLNCPRKLPRDQALAMVRAMLGELERHTGKRPIIYTDITFHDEVLRGEFNDYPFWIRSVAAEPHERYADRRWTFWQWTTTGRVPGIIGGVDRNVFNGGEEEWIAWLRRVRVIAPPPVAEATASIRSPLPF